MSSLPFDALVVAPNSAVDSYYLLDRLDLGKVNGATEVVHTAGGKGINMARALKTLGGRPLCAGLVGGHAGAFIQAELAREGLDADLAWTDQESRRCNTLWVRGTSDTTVTLEAGRPTPPESIAALTEIVLQRTPEAFCTVFTGSTPPNFHDTYYASMVETLKAQGRRTAVDCSKNALVHALEAGPWLVKVNEGEICGARGLPVHRLEPAEAADIFAAVRRRGTEILALTLGSRGAYVFAADGTGIHLRTPAHTMVSTAGAGDTFLAALLLGLSRGENVRDAARFGSAAATAGLMQLGCGVLDPGLVPSFLAETQVVELGIPTPVGSM